MWVVLRLCTNEKKVIKYWNDIDRELELELDVVDDMIAEATEVAQHNGWLTYGEPLQRYTHIACCIQYGCCKIGDWRAVDIENLERS